MIESLMQQLELLAVVIEEMEMIYKSSPRDQSRPFNSQAMQLSMRRYREAMDALEDLIDKLTQHVGSQKRFKRAKAKLKVALGKYDLDQYQSRLNNAVQLLQVAQGCYQMSLNGAILQRLITLPTLLDSQPEAKAMELESSATESQLESGDKETNHSIADDEDKTEVKKTAILVQNAPMSRAWHSVKRTLGPFVSYSWYSSEIKDDESGFVQKGLYFRLELAQWLSGKAWEIQATRAMSGWHHHLKTYNIVPRDSEIMRCVMKGDLERIKYLFQNNLASIHDRNEYGLSLLSHAVTIMFYSKKFEGLDDIKPWYELVKFLHECGLDIAEKTQHEAPALTWFLLLPSWEVYMPWLYTCWKSSEAAGNSDAADMKAFFLSNGYTYTAFTTFQPAVQPDFYRSPISERVEKWLLHRSTKDHRLFRNIVHEDAIINRGDAVELAKEGINLFSLATHSFVASRHYKQYDQAGWNGLIQELVLRTGDISLQQEAYSHYDIQIGGGGMYSGNPLMACILTATYNFSSLRFGSRNWSFEKHLHTEVIRWLQILRDCKIDLETYGQREHSMIFRKGKKRRTLALWDEEWTWTGFSWGPNPRDWVFHLDREVERFSGDFWWLIDNPLQPVPGAWID